jgi:hypothetical protein
VGVKLNHTIIHSRDKRKDPSGHLLEIITRPYGSGG